MNTIEDRLRDAYRAATETVEPGSIRPLAEHGLTVSDTGSLGVRSSGRWPRRLIIPMAAAAAVAAIAVLTTLIVPRLIAGTRPGGGQTPATPTARFAVALSPMAGVYSEGAKALTIFNAISGATVATIAAPGHDRYFTGVATGDGRHFVAEVHRPGVCRTWLYQFRLGQAGRPGPLSAYPVRSIGNLLTDMAISRDGSTLAYAAAGCAPATASFPAHRSFPAHLAIIHPAGGQARQWTLPGRASVLSLSLTAHGTLLAYDTRTADLARSATYLLPTSAADGPAATRSRLAVASDRFGRSIAINSAAITLDGRQVYFTTSPVLPTSHARWQLRAVELATGRIRVVGRYAGFPAYLTADPSVRYALVIDSLAPTSQRTATVTATPSPGRSRLPTATPSVRSSSLATPTPSASSSSFAAPTPSASGNSQLATPTPSASSRSRLPTPSPSPSGKSQQPTPTPSATSSRLPTPAPSPTGSARPLAARLELINLTTGRIRVILPVTSPALAGTIFVW